MKKFLVFLIVIVFGIAAVVQFSGSAAVGAYLAARRGSEIDLALQEPGGILRVKAAPDGPIFLSGTVILTKEVALDMGD